MDNNEKMGKKGKAVQLPIELSPDLKQIYVTGAFGSFTNHDFRMLLLNEKSKQGSTPGMINLVREGDYELIMTHSAVKSIHDWLGKAIDQFEKQVGKIETIKVEEN